MPLGAGLWRGRGTAQVAEVRRAERSVSGKSMRNGRERSIGYAYAQWRRVSGEAAETSGAGHGASSRARQRGREGLFASPIAQGEPGQRRRVFEAGTLFRSAIGNGFADWLMNFCACELTKTPIKAAFYALTRRVFVGIN